MNFIHDAIFIFSGAFPPCCSEGNFKSESTCLKASRAEMEDSLVIKAGKVIVGYIQYFLKIKHDR